MEFSKEYRQILKVCKQQRKALYDSVYTIDIPIIEKEKKKRVSSVEIKELLLQGFSIPNICLQLGCNNSRVNDVITKFKIATYKIDGRIYIANLLEKVFTLCKRGLNAEKIATKLNIPECNARDYVCCITNLKENSRKYNDFFSPKETKYTSLSELSDSDKGKIIKLLSDKVSTRDIMYEMDVSEEVIKEIKDECKKYGLKL